MNPEAQYVPVPAQRAIFHHSSPSRSAIPSVLLFCGNLSVQTDLATWPPSLDIQHVRLRRVFVDGNNIFTLKIICIYVIHMTLFLFFFRYCRMDHSNHSQQSSWYNSVSVESCLCLTFSLSVGRAWAPFMMTSWTLSTDRSLPACSRRWLKKPITYW